jgi:hypothetical protein
MRGVLLVTMCAVGGCSSSQPCNAQTCSWGCCTADGVCQACSAGGGAGGGSAGGTGGGTAGSLGGGGGGGAALKNAFFPDGSPEATNGTTPEVAIDSMGQVHYVYFGFTGNGQGYPVRYGLCPSNCKDPSRWSFVTVTDAGLFGSEVRLALDANGHPRITFQYAVGTSGGEVRYAACDANCAQSASSWTVGTAHPFISGGNTYTHGRHNFAVDRNGRPHLIYASYEAGTNRTTYLTCSGNCVAGAAGWTSTLLDGMHQLLASVAVTPQGGVRAIFTGDGDMGNLLSYRQCDSGCDNIANWTADQPLYFSNGGQSRIRVDSAGKIRIAWYQGQSGVAAGMSSDNQLLYGGCDSSCTNPMSWVGVTVGTGSMDGQDGLDMDIDVSDTPAIAYRPVLGGLGLALCTANCNSSPTWTLTTLETSDGIGAEVAPKLPVCTTTQNPNPAASWAPGVQPSISVGGSTVVIGHAVQTLQQCKPSGTIQQGPQLARVHLLP